MIEYAFFRNALVGIIILSIAVAVVGTYIVTRRLVSIAGGITHACFGGLGLGYFLGLNPILMAGAVATASSLGIDWLSRRHNVRSDTAVAVFWAAGMAMGVVFVFLTPGYVPELNNFLFGNILTITRADLWAFSVYTALLLAYYSLNFRVITACAFDPDFARVNRLPVTLVNTLMSVFIAVGIVLTIRLVGVMLLMSLVTLPQMIAEIFTRRLRQMVICAAAVSLIGCVAGLALATIVNVPCSALMVIVLIALYIAAKAIKAGFRALQLSR